ncbi:MAG: hypothetical protein JJU12_01595 [Chlamydiales bacterium]|nr:hypothetical protein [Chlamydiales bacterium]
MEQLLEHEFFPWGGLPYPCEHAKKGLELIRKGDIETAKKMAAFQQATIDHRGKPLYPLFQQERGCRFAELERANSAFFDALAVEQAPEYRYLDSELGIVFHRTPEQTVVCLASGCKSGMATFLVRQGGVLNLGLQLLPLGECAGFGLAGRGRNIEISENALGYICRLAAPHDRDTGIPWLKDSGYSAAWVESACAIHPDRLSLACTLEGFRPLTDLLFTCFLKADACFVAGSHKLNPRSLDRYQGPPQTIKIDGLTITPEAGFRVMEVVPLAGDESFWGADFMMSLTLLNKTFQFTISRGHE